MVVSVKVGQKAELLSDKMERNHRALSYFSVEDGDGQLLLQNFGLEYILSLNYGNHCIH